MNPSNLSKLQIDPEMKKRPRGSVLGFFFVVSLVLLVALYFALFRGGDDRKIKGTNPQLTKETASAAAVADKPLIQASAPVPTSANPKTLTVSGYIVNRERIEISPRFQGVVQWIGIKKGDLVDKDQVVVRLDDAEYKARVSEAEGRLASVKVSVERAELAYRRVHDLFSRNVVSAEADDEARLTVDATKAQLRETEAQLALAKTYLDWTVIRSPVKGVILEKLVKPGELVVPMSYGGTRGPSTALLAVADLSDLQVEIDLNESDLAKISLGRGCNVIPEAYPDKKYEGRVAEIAPEANRQKGTLQIKVQILKPDRFLTPELTAKVEFLP